MADLLERGNSMLESKRQSNMTQQVTYGRASLVSDPIGATIGKTTFEQADDSGIISRFESRDYIVAVELLADFGEPAAGDTITEGDETYEVMAPGSEPPWRYADTYRRAFRIHTKRIT